MINERARKFLIAILMPLGVLIWGKSHLCITQNYKNDHFSSVFDQFLALVAMVTTENFQNTHE